MWSWVTLYYDMSSGQSANGKTTLDNGPVGVSLDVYCSTTGTTLPGTGKSLGGTGDRTCATAGGPAHARPARPRVGDGDGLRLQLRREGHRRRHDRPPTALTELTEPTEPTAL